jgi:hypothetical protein
METAMATVSQTRTRALTYADLDRFPETETGNRYEIIAGELVVTPSPNPFQASLTPELIIVVGRFVQDGDRGGLLRPGRCGVG